ncbi:beta-1,3-galactosyltransferase brn-like [Ylistrum balloti]|uniref:beta-1,3-galactosyltransferase brn-like n=1 Tax=Ylistrum balloti TaxID=509963 RepID=UPI002905B4EC|nr:beta-1,3-galactosyltransferase brn-like [Ylistrum balloti]
MRVWRFRRCKAVKGFLSLSAVLVILLYIVVLRHHKCINSLKVYPMQKALPDRMIGYPLNIDFTKLVEDVNEKGYKMFKPINIYPYSYLKPIPNICGSSNEIFLLFMIKSAPRNFDQRKAIRETWTNTMYVRKHIIRHVFLLAKTSNYDVNNRLSIEKEMHQDILEMTYVDNYYNNTYKTIGGINWCVKYCSKAKFVMLVDDDFYIATDYLLAYLHGLPQNMYSSLYAGHVWNTYPQRCLHQKWYMSFEDYPFDRYPPFLSAGAIIMSMDVVKRLQIGIQYTKMFKFDDVFIAIVAYKLNIKPVHHPGVRVGEAVLYHEDFTTVLASHGYRNANDLRAAWQKSDDTSDEEDLPPLQAVIDRARKERDNSDEEDTIPIAELRQRLRLRKLHQRDQEKSSTSNNLSESNYDLEMETDVTGNDTEQNESDTESEQGHLYNTYMSDDFDNFAVNTVGNVNLHSLTPFGTFREFC